MVEGIGTKTQSSMQAFCQFRLWKQDLYMNICQWKSSSHSVKPHMLSSRMIFGDGGREPFDGWFIFLAYIIQFLFPVVSIHHLHLSLSMRKWLFPVLTTFNFRLLYSTFKLCIDENGSLSLSTTTEKLGEHYSKKFWRSS